MKIDKAYSVLKDSVIRAELILLRILAFDVHVPNPYVCATSILTALKLHPSYNIATENANRRVFYEMTFVVLGDLVLDRQICLDILVSEFGAVDLALAAIYVSSIALKLDYVIKPNLKDWCGSWGNEDSFNRVQIVIERLNKVVDS